MLRGRIFLRSVTCTNRSFCEANATAYRANFQAFHSAITLTDAVTYATLAATNYVPLFKAYMASITSTFTAADFKSFPKPDILAIFGALDEPLTVTNTLAISSTQSTAHSTATFTSPHPGAVAASFAATHARPNDDAYNETIHWTLC